MMANSCSQPTVQKETVQKSATTAASDTTHLVGMWLDEDIKTDNGEQVAYQIVTQDVKTYIQVITFKEKKLSVNDNPEIGPSAQLVTKKENRYISVDDAKNIFQVEKAGDLLIYDGTGFIAKCKRML